MRRLRRERRGSTALEFALCFPAVLLAVFTLFALYSLIVCKRAMDFGVERSLRYAVVHSAGGSVAAVNAYKTAAGQIWNSVGSNSTVTFKVNGAAATTFKPGDTVHVTASYYWAAPAVLTGMLANLIFIPVTLTVDGSMQVMN